MTLAAPITSVCWRPWRIPLLEAVSTSAGGFTEREGLIVKIETADGAIGLGECSPLPAEGLTVISLAERMKQVGGALVGSVPCWAGVNRLLRRGMEGADVAIECAVGDLLSRSRGVPLNQWLADQQGLPANGPTEIPANALLSAKDPIAIASEAQVAKQNSFDTVKVKVGHDVLLDYERLKAVREVLGPDVELRIDANGAWTKEEALVALASHKTHRIALCEQPVANGSDAAAGLAFVRSGSTIPIAADESCASGRDLRSLLAADAVDAIVIKPLRTGMVEALDIITEAVTHELPCILTTTLDTGVGTALALHLATLLPPPRPACGVATLPLLYGDLVQGCPNPSRGSISLPAGPGLGVTLDEDALNHFAIGPWEGLSE
ncbi:MAG: hypothetical protein CL897_02490 [Dehalococcoidia bacterium]|nr:hypothetical protein [Dehalococcoidia bacterium]HCV00768.1 hypothetical protein [Dehalococcoidia bacterium]|tara:strand:- start:6617 stop:7753 length:1137 start_codon:yes stop_codon:yes gene_type:complete